MWREAAKDQQELGPHMCLLLIKEFLTKEMKIPVSVMREVDVVAIHPPKKYPEEYPSDLEVVFANQKSVKIVESFRETLYRTRNINVEENMICKVELSVAPQMKSRFQALQGIAKRRRDDPENPMKTYIVYDTKTFEDFELWVRPKSDKNAPFTKSEITADRKGEYLPTRWEKEPEKRTYGKPLKKREVKDTFRSTSRVRSESQKRGREASGITPDGKKISDVHRILADNSPTEIAKKNKEREEKEAREKREREREERDRERAEREERERRAQSTSMSRGGGAPLRGGRAYGGTRPKSSSSVIYTPEEMETDSEQSEKTPIAELINEDVWGFGGNISDELELDFLIYLNDFDESSTKCK